MLFNSIEFIIFLPIVFLFLALLPHRARQPFLLLASLFFYGRWRPEYLLLMLTSIILTWGCAILLDTWTKYRKQLLASVIIANLLILALFKYSSFTVRSTVDTFRLFGISLNWRVPQFLLPVGISFYTFQALGYAIDVYRKDTPVERNIVTYALFVSYFPQLVAGPIERSGNLLHQVKHIDGRIDPDDAVAGLKWMAWGYFKKLVIADRAAIIVNSIYDASSGKVGFVWIIATIAFAFQIYCDFSAYSDIATGASRIIGVRLMRNFRQPYLSKSMGEFWRRWHISLSTWFRDYVYIPLGGGRVTPFRRLINLLATFLVSGLWHGANWTFVVWGAYNGALVALSNTFERRFLRKSKTSAPFLSQILHGARKTAAMGFTFMLACFGWSLFRAKGLSQFFYIATHFLPLAAERNLKGLFHYASNALSKKSLGISEFDAVILAASICMLLLFDMLADRGKVNTIIARIPWLIRWPLYITFVLTILVLGVFGNNEFIYFQF